MIDENELFPLISKDLRLRLVEPYIYSIYPHGMDNISYDNMGAFYDLVLCNRFYNRLMWGYSVTDYASLTHDVLRSSTNGWVLDAGCGSLAFTARTYVSYSERPVILLDRSIRMLRAAKARMIKLNGHVPANMTFFHGDILQLPFVPKSFHTIISLNVLHVLEDMKKMLLELKNAVVDEGTMSFTTLVTNNRCSDRYLNILGLSAEVVPRNASQLAATFNELDMPTDYHVRGNMMFIHYRGSRYEAE